MKISLKSIIIQSKIIVRYIISYNPYKQIDNESFYLYDFFVNNVLNRLLLTKWLLCSKIKVIVKVICILIAKNNL